MKAPRGRGSIALLTSTLDGMSGQRQASAALYPREKDPRYPLDRRLGGPQSRSEHRSLFRGLNPGHPVCSQTL
jgi:hypothetical protein